MELLQIRAVLPKANACIWHLWISCFTG